MDCRTGIFEFSRTFIKVTVLAVLMFCVDSVVAQGGPIIPNIPGFPGTGGGSGTEGYAAVASPGEGFGKYYRDIVNSDFADSLIDPENDFSGFSTIANIQNNIAAIHLSPGNPCTGASCGLAPNEGQIVPGSRGIPLQALIPGAMKAEADYLWSTDAVNMSQNNLNSPQVVRDVSLFLAESAVAQGEANARMKAANLTNNTMLQNIAFGLASSKFEGSQAAYQTYYWCIQNQLKEGSGFAKAHQICGRDDGNRGTNAAGAIGNAPGFTFADNPAHDSGDDNEILLTEIIFNEEIASSVNGVAIEDAKEAFEELYGDIAFTLDGSGSALAHAYKVMSPILSPSQAYETIIIQKFNSLREIIKSYCEFSNNKVTQDTPSNEDFQRIYEKDGTNGVGNVSAEHLKRVSAPGFSMTPAIITGLRLLYQAFYLGHENAPQPQDQKMWCGPLENSGGFEVAVGSPDGFKKFYGNLKPVGGTPFFQSLYHMARLLALVEWLGRGAIAEQIIEFMSVGINDGSDYERLAKDLIYRGVGTRNIKADMEQVNAQLREYAVANFEVRATQHSMAAQAGSNIAQEGQASRGGL